MTYFDVKKQGLYSAKGDLDSYKKELADIWGEIGSIRRGISLGTSTAGIQRRLTSAGDLVARERDGMAGLSNGLEQCVTCYYDTEGRLTGKSTGNNTNTNNTSTSSNTSGTSWMSSDWAKTAAGVVGKAGLVGGIGKAVYDVVKGKGSVASWASAAKDIYKPAVKLGRKIYEAKKGTSVDWKDVFVGLAKKPTGLQDLAKSGLSVADRAKHGFDYGIKNSLRKFNKPGDCATEVGGLVVAAAANFFGNLDEYKGNFKDNKGRIIAETVTETAVDWGKGLLIGAAVSAGFAAAGIAAPALAVGAATVVVSGLIDVGWKAITGSKDGLTECISDAIIDGGTKAVKAATKAVKTGWSNVKNGWKCITKGIGKAFA